MTDPCSPSRPGEYPSDCELLEGYRQLARDRATNGQSEDVSALVLEKATAIRLLLLDVDGVLTDGTLLYSSTGEEYKAFNTQDGFGITLLREAGIETGIITARISETVRRRGEELKITHLYQGIRKKNEAFREIVKKTGLKPFEIAYMGDDWLDLGLLRQVGLAIAPANGAEEVQRAVHYVTPRGGGHGAVRDACNLILRARGELDNLLRKYLCG